MPAGGGKTKVKRPLGKNEQFVEYKFVEMANGHKKRKKVIKRIDRKIRWLTQEQKEEIDNAFMLFDRDNNNFIDIVELKDALRALGVFLKKDQVRTFMEQADKDGSGGIDRVEFMALMAELIERRDQKKELSKVFNMYDDNDNGLINSSNLL